MKPSRAQQGKNSLHRRTFLGVLSGTVASLVRAETHAKAAESASRVPRIREANSGSPLVKIYNSTWALRGLPRGGKEWSFEEKLTRVKDAGFVGIETEDVLENEHHAIGLIRKLGLDLGMGSSKILRSAEEVRQGLEICKRTGAKYYVIVAGDAFMTDDAAAALVKDSIQASYDLGVPLLFETHRRSLTENCYRVLKLIDRVPEIRFCADLSHFVVSGSMGGASAQEWVQRWGPILDRSDSFQCRISNGEQVQVDVGDGSSKLAQKWVELWAEILRRWIKRAPLCANVDETSALA